jgi:DNA-binding transcriptional LysR family regulator
VSFEQIRYFVTVAEEGNMGRAAKRLNICQPPLSRQIQQLEQELGAPLFQRTARGVNLLPVGVQFLSHARKILDDVELARQAVRQEQLAAMATGTSSPPPKPQPA